jgi:hypothetical protein
MSHLTKEGIQFDDVAGPISHERNLSGHEHFANRGDAKPTIGVGHAV